MSRVKLCYKESCNRRVLSVGLCAIHYELLVFGDEPAILAELEELCANQLCVEPVKQKRDELGNVVNRTTYCTQCRNTQGKDGNQRIPVTPDIAEECSTCLKVYDRKYIVEQRGKCESCREEARKEQYRKQLAYQRERRRRKAGK